LTLQDLSRRVLFLVWGSIEREQGASQIALSLCDALIAAGQKSEVQGLGGSSGSSRVLAPLSRGRRASTTMALSAGALDAVDLPAQFVTPALARMTKVVARSVQPEHGYVTSMRSGQRKLAIWHVRRLVHRFHEQRVLKGIERGRRIAHRILCLGTAELEEVVRRQPDLKRKAAAYVAAPSEKERALLRLVAQARRIQSRRTENADYLWIGRWAAHKGTHRVIRFVAEFLRTHPGASLTIAGAGDLADHPVVSWLAREDRVRVVPRYNREELPCLLKEHDAGLFTSEIEGWGLSLQEMLESGLPVFATRTGAFQDLAPWFPSQLREFPPEEGALLPESESVEAFSRYAARFNWQQIAADYLRDVFGGEPRE